MSFKVAFIGAGSIGFTRRLLSDILTVPELRDIEVAFTDINEENLRMVTQLCQDFPSRYTRRWIAGRPFRMQNM